jgi:tryptophan-rich sensory protein
MIARYAPLAAFLLLATLTSLTGSGFEAGEWYYTTMRQPSWWPPGWFFVMAWTVVYVTMALAAWHTWNSGHFSRTGAITWWVLLLVLNVCWFALFFGLHRPGYSLLLLSVMAGLSLFCIRAFGKLSRQAALMMLPYLFWIICLWTLNLVIWSYNGGLLEPLFWKP